MFSFVIQFMYLRAVPCYFELAPIPQKWSILLLKLGAHFYGQPRQQNRGGGGTQMAIRVLSHQVAEEYSLNRPSIKASQFFPLYFSCTNVAQNFDWKNAAHEGVGITAFQAHLVL